MMLSRVLELELNFVFLSCKTNVLKNFNKSKGYLGNLVYVIWLVNHYINVILADIFKKSIFIAIDNGISNSHKLNHQGFWREDYKTLKPFCYNMQGLVEFLILTILAISSIDFWQRCPLNLFFPKLRKQFAGKFLRVCSILDISGDGWRNHCTVYLRLAYCLISFFLSFCNNYY